MYKICGEELEEGIQALSLRKEDYHLYKQYASKGLAHIFWDSYLEGERQCGLKRDIEKVRCQYQDFYHVEMIGKISSNSLEISVSGEKSKNVLDLLCSDESDIFACALFGHLGCQSNIFNDFSDPGLFHRISHTSSTISYSI